MVRWKRCAQPGSARPRVATPGGCSPRCVPRIVGIHGLLHVGSVAGYALPVRPLSVAVLFARALRRPQDRLVRRKARWWPGWLVFSPAMLILWAPGGFRFTCYYYRGAYYKAFWADPPSCAVGEPRKTYCGERSVPADHAEHPPLLSLPGAASSSSSWRTTPGRRCGSTDPATGTAASASASARWS